MSPEMSEFANSPHLFGDSSRGNHRPSHLLARVLDAAPEYAVFTLNRDGVIQTWSASAQRLFGNTADDLVARRFSVLCFPASGDDDQLEHALSSSRNEPRIELNLRLRRQDGSKFPAHVVLFAAGSSTSDSDELIVVVRDLSDHETRLRQLQDQRRRFRSVFETAVEAIVIIDDRGTIDSVNPAAERMFGYDAGELVGQNVRLLMPEPYASEHASYIRRYLETGKAKVIGIGRTIQARRKDGSRFPADLAVSSFQDGRPYFTGILRDASQRKQLEAEILHIAEAEQRRIGQELHDDVQQQLTGSLLIARHLAAGLHRLAESDPAAAPLLESAEKLSEALRQAGQSLRELARGLVPARVNARGLSAALEDLAVHVNEAHAVVCSYISEGEPVPPSDQTATHLYRIAQEAVQNALKHSQAQELRIRLIGADRSLTLEIVDNGIGIDIDDHSAGRGMQIMRYRADLIGAGLTVNRGDHGGTVIRCVLPDHGET